MKKTVRISLALFLAFAVLFQYSFSPSVITAYGLSDDSVEVQLAQSGQADDDADAQEEEKASEPEQQAPSTTASEPEQKSEPAPAPEPEPEKSESVSTDEPQSEPEPAAESSDETASEKGDTSEKASDADKDDADEDDADKEDEEKEKYPATSFSKSVSGLSVKISAPKGALPEGATVKVTPVASSQVMGTVEGIVGDVDKVKAADITFYDKDGKEVHPKKAVSVTMTASGLEADSVIHVADSGAANIVGASTSGGTASFNASDFSIYIVVDEGETGEDARLAVKFIKADGTEAEMRITERQVSHIEQYIYDPGVGEMPEGATFKGWTSDEGYTASTKAKTIADIRKDVKEMLEAGVEEGDSITFYAMVFKSFTVTFLDEEGVTLKNDRALYRLDDESAREYTVNLSYTPYVRAEDEAAGITAEFTGWQQIEPQVEDKVVYQNGNSFTLESDVTLRATVDHGHWLSFNENLPGASYTQPQFVTAGGHPTAPANPTCTGYTFDGWYTEDASSERDGQVAGDKITNFSEMDLTANTTLHAKWNKNETANYTVLIWKQNVSGTGYDFEESVSLNGPVDGVIDTIDERGTGDGRYAVVDGTNKRYTGFHLDRYDTNVTINTEGNSVVNVYYNRNQVTLTFVYRDNGRWATQETMTGLYGQTLESQGYTWPTNRWWYDSYDSNWNGYYGAGTRTTFLDAFILSDGSSSQTFYGFAGNGNNTVHFLKQDANNTNNYTEASSVGTSNGTFYISDKFSGFHAASYSTNGRTWTQLGDKNAQGYYASVSNYSDLYIRYDRDAYSILFMDGVYATGSDPEHYNKSGERLGEVNDIMFGADVSSYANYKDTALQHEMHNYVFMGWYADDKCNTLYDFDTMPEGGITVYAKWLKKEYQVNLHNNADGDPSFAYNSATQAEEFWVENGEKVGNVGGERTYYDLVGWYTDEACTHAYDFDLFVINDDTLAAIGTLYGEDDIDPAYPNTVGELNLYAKWRSKLVGAKGINVVYDETSDGQQGSAPVDNNQYVDKSEAIASGGSKPASEDMVFSHWVLQKWNGSAFVDTDEELFPGDTFTVLVDNARITDNNDGDKVVTKEELKKDGSYTYTVKLRAAYIEKDKETLSHIYWYDNYTGNTIRKDENLKINQDVTVPAAPERAGYEFKGWVRDIEENGPTTSSTDLFIKYDDNYAGTRVAPDENLVGDGTQHHALYALWEAVDTEYTVEFYYQNVNGEGFTKDDSMTDTRTAKTDSEVAVTGEDKAQTKDGKYEFDSANTSNVLEGTVAADGSTVLKLYFTCRTADVTVEHYLKGEDEPFKTDTVKDRTIGSTYQATPETKYQEKNLTVNSYDPSQSITVKTSGNVIKIYYTLPLTITAKTDSKTYDGKPLNGEYTIEGALEADEAAIESALGEAPSITEVSESPLDYLTEEEQKEIEGIPEYYVVEYVSGTLTITPLDVTVKITGNKDSKVYNGEEQKVEGYEVKISDKLYTEDDFTFSGEDVAKGTDVDKYPMGLAEDQFENTNDNFNVTFEVTDGELEITPLAVTVTITGHNDTQIYDAEEHQVEGYDVDISNKLYTENDFTFSGEAIAKGTDVNKYPMGLEEDQFTNNNDNFDVTFNVTDGELEITPIDEVVVTITGHHSTDEYDGEEHQVEGYDVDISNPLYTEDDFTFSGEAAAKGTDVNKYMMGLSEDQFKNINSNFKKVTFKVTDGYEEITPLSITVTITGNKDSLVFNGEEQKVEGYEVEISDKLYTEDDFTFSGEAVAKGTDVDTYEMGLAEDQFTNNNDNFDVTFEVTDGELEITPLAVTVTITGNKDSKVYNGEEQKVEGYEVEISDKLYTEDDFTFSGEAVAKGTDVDKYPMGLAEDQFKNNNDNFDVTFTVTDGELEITPLAVTVTITGNKDSKVYNGEEQKVEGYKAEISDKLYTEKDFTFSGDAVAKGTDVDKYSMGLAEDQFKNNNDNFDVTFEVTDGELEITPLAVTVTITGNKDSKVYNGKEQKVEGYKAEISDKLYTEKDFTFSGEAVAKGTDVDEYSMGLAEDQFKNNNDNFEVTFTVTDGELEITKRNVILTSATDSKQYDGKALTNSEVTVSGDGFVEGEGANYDVTGSQTEVGSSDNEFTYELKEGTKAGNYNIETVLGKLTVNKNSKEIVLTAASASRTYNGNAFTAKKVSVTGLPEGFTVEAATKGSRTNAGTSKNVVADNYIIRDAEGNDVTANFTNIKKVDGKLTVKKKAVVITTGSSSKVFDGRVLRNSNASITGLVDGESVDLTATGSQLVAGSSKNTYSIKWTAADKNNYKITEKLGTLRVTPAPPVDDDDTPTPTPTPGPTPAPTPAPPAADGGTPIAAAITDAPAPTADAPTAIEDEPAPLAAPAYWALINLLCAIATALLSLILLITYFGKRSEEEDDEETGETTETEIKRKGVARLLSLIPAIGAIVAFILTEDMRNPMIWVDKWTLLMVVILAVQVIVAIIAKKKKDDDDDSEYAEANA